MAEDKNRNTGQPSGGQGNAGNNTSSSLSMDSMSECLYEITDDYLASLTPGQYPSPKKIQNELLARVSAEFDAINTAKGKGSRWKKPDVLEPFMIAEIIRVIYPVKLIAFNGMAGTRETDMLGMYQFSGRDEGIYDTNDDALRYLIRQFNRGITMKQIKEVIAALKDTVERVEPCHKKNLIAVGNGIFDYDRKVLMPFSPEIVFTSKSYVPYDPSAVNPVIVQADGTTWDFDSWFNSLSDDPEVVDVLKKVVGACIRPNVPWNISAWFYSESGNNGKGTICELIRALIGEEHCAAITLADFSKEFHLEELTHATAIVTDENDVGTYVDKAANLKAVITGDMFKLNRKFKEVISFRFHGFMVQCLNEMPKIKDKSDSFYRRQLFVPFDKCFTGHENKLIKSDYLHRPETLKYAMKEILESDYYEIKAPEACQFAKENFKKSNDPVRQFLDEVLGELQWDFVPWTFLHDVYKAWYEQNFSGKNVESTSTLAKRVTELLPSYGGWDAVPDTKKVRPAGRMGKAEPLIDAYELKHWLNKRYKTAVDRTKACTPVPAEKYWGGLVRQVGNNAGSDAGSNDN